VTIIGLLERIKNNEIVLPAIQRNFVWEENKIERLLDSIMRGYPIGIVLLWETYNNIQNRHFASDYLSDVRYIFEDNEKQNRINLVLDGQQRLSRFTSVSTELMKARAAILMSLAVEILKTFKKTNLFLIS
jgi:uncharacterized protein with ParB-like and HNH nuclease domain